MKSTAAPQCRKTTIPHIVGGEEHQLGIHIVEGLRYIREVERYKFDGVDHVKFEIDPEHMVALQRAVPDSYELCHAYIKLEGNAQRWFGTHYEDGCLIVRKVESIERAVAGYSW